MDTELTNHFVEVFRQRLDSLPNNSGSPNDWGPEVYQQLGIKNPKKRMACVIFRRDGFDFHDIWIEDPLEKEMKRTEKYWFLHIETNERLMSYMRNNNIPFNYPVSSLGAFIIEDNDGLITLVGLESYMTPHSLSNTLTRTIEMYQISRIVG